MAKSQGDYLKMGCTEFIKFIWRVAQHVYSEQSYHSDDPEEEVDIPKEIVKMFEKPPFYKFIFVMETLLNYTGVIEETKSKGLSYPAESGEVVEEEPFDIAEALAACLSPDEAEEFKMRIYE